MCSHGDDVLLLVPIDPKLAHDDKFRWDYRGIDRCIAPIVEALNNAGVYTANCCCGHGKGDGSIALHDGRELVIKAAPSKRAMPCGTCGGSEIVAGRNEYEADPCPSCKAR